MTDKIIKIAFLILGLLFLREYRDQHRFVTHGDHFVLDTRTGLVYLEQANDKQVPGTIVELPRSEVKPLGRRDQEDDDSYL